MEPLFTMSTSVERGGKGFLGFYDFSSATYRKKKHKYFPNFFYESGRGGVNLSQIVYDVIK